MSVDIQLSSFILFIIFGFIMAVGYELFLKTKLIKLYIFTIIATIIFTYSLFKTNGGIIHPYFFIAFGISCIISKITVNKAKIKIKRLLKKVLNAIMPNRGRL